MSMTCDRSQGDEVMSCFHGNPHDDCDLCEAIDSVWRKYSDLKTEKDARIAELTEGHRSLVDEVAKQVLRVTQLTAEVSRYKAALEGIVGLNGGHRSETNSLLNDTQTIARNALKEGV